MSCLNHIFYTDVLYSLKICVMSCLRSLPYYDTSDSSTSRLFTVINTYLFSRTFKSIKIGGFKFRYRAQPQTQHPHHQSPLKNHKGEYLTMKFFVILASSFCCASAFGLHSATSSVKNVAYGLTKSSKPMVQPIDLSGRVTTVANARESMVSL
jgi:hypothetical protein